MAQQVPVVVAVVQVEQVAMPQVQVQVVPQEVKGE
jgi:hypothetical protein